MNKEEKSLRKEAKSVDYDPFAEPELEAVVPSTEMQLEIWTSSQMGNDASCAFNESCTMHFVGPLDSRAMHSAIQDVVQRHQSLRSTFSADGEQMYIAKTLFIDLPESQLSDDVRIDEAITEAVAKEVDIAFDLERGPLFRAQLLHRNKQEHYLFLTAHHIVCDGWSLEVIINDLGAFYSAYVNEQTCILERAPQYGEYAIASRTELVQKEQREAREYWLDVLSGEVPTLELPLDKTRPDQRTFSSARVDHRLPPQLVDNLKHFGAERRASFFTVLLAGFQMLLHRLTGQNDIITGIPHAEQSQAGLTFLVGHCVNLLPIRSSIKSSDTFHDYLEQIRCRMLDAHDHHQCTFGSLVPDLIINRQANRIPLVSVIFGYYKMTENSAQKFQHLQSQFSVNARTHENFELFVSTIEDQGKVIFETQYNTDLFDGETIARWMKALEVLLYAVAEKADRPIAELPLLDETDRQMIRDWNETKIPYRQDVCLHQLFAERAAEIPEKEAVQDETRILSYAELDARSDRLAAYLVTEGVKAGEFVGIYMRRSVDMLISVIGILKSGAAYLPLDPAYPQDRLKYMIEDAAVRRIVTETQLERKYLGEQLSSDALIIYDQMSDVFQYQDCSVLKGVKTDPENNAYIIYTSGSTGKPKGVQVPHRAVINFLTSMAEQPGMTDEDVLLAVTTLSFDISVLEVFLPLFVGAKTVIASHEKAGDGVMLAKLLRDSGATIMQATPTTWRMLHIAGWKNEQGLKILCGGEAFPKDLAKELLKISSDVWNMYGPTETTVWSACHKLTSAENILIGRPIGNTQIYILDSNLKTVLTGVPGELYIGGDGVTRGYLHRKDLNQECFLPDPFSNVDGARMYKTGDLAKIRNDGNIEYLNRIDNQVKVRGFRIELGEIETVLSTHPAIKQSVVAVREDRPGDVRLVAYIVPLPGQDVTVTEVRKHLRSTLPDYMIPQHVVELDAIPMTPSGKIDRKVLPSPFSAGAGDEDVYIAPRTETEQALAAIWQEVLGVDRVGIHDNFFDMGGHSLLSMHLISCIKDRLDIVMNPREILLNNLEQLAEYCDNKATVNPQQSPSGNPTDISTRLFGKLKNKLGSSEV
jgi:amino acid adenylation domain-containing protein